jgi:NAD(P)-dependent dehydrogenase (short-subunit alcohol dehydrogenase family)
MAEQLALRGWQVVAVARTVGGLEDLDDRVKRAGLPGAGSLTLAPMDVTNDDAMRHLCRSIHDRWGGLKLWVHAAIHAAPLAPPGSLDQKDWDKSIATNARAAGMLIPMVEPLLRAHDGHRAVSLTIPAPGSRSSAPMARPRRHRLRWRKAGRPRRQARAAGRDRRTGGMPTATRARFFPGEDRAKLADVQDEARRILDTL